MKIKIDGTEFDAPEGVVKFMTAQQNRIDEMEARLDEADTVDIKGTVKARVDLIEKAKRILGNSVKLDEMDDLEIKKATITKRHPGVKLDEKESAYIDARFDAVIESIGGEALGSIAPVIQPGTTRGDEGDKNIHKDLRSQWKKPLTYSAP